ncbi:unnamed protein product [Adineta ricciae]|nr:unnamed protein product [Adineta ricciae]
MGQQRSPTAFKVYRVEHEVNASPIELDDVGVDNTSWTYDDSAGIRDYFRFFRGNHLAARLIGQTFIVTSRSH